MFEFRIKKTIALGNIRIPAGQIMFGRVGEQLCGHTHTKQMIRNWLDNGLIEPHPSVEAMIMATPERR